MTVVNKTSFICSRWKECPLFVMQKQLAERYCAWSSCNEKLNIHHKSISTFSDFSSSLLLTSKLLLWGFTSVICKYICRLCFSQKILCDIISFQSTAACWVKSQQSDLWRTKSIVWGIFASPLHEKMWFGNQRLKPKFKSNLPWAYLTPHVKILNISITVTFHSRKKILRLMYL